MARVCRWQVPFMSLDNKKYRVDIYQENYSGNVEVLKGGANPFYTQEDDDEDAFFPIRTSSGYLTVIVEDMQLIDDILPNDDHDRYVELIDETDTLNEVCVWNGFIAPDQYSGTWDKTPFELQLPLLSPLEAAKAIQFTPTARMRDVRSLIKNLFQSYIDFVPEYLYIAKLDDEETTPSRCPFLDAVLTDHIFLPEEENNDLVPIVGSDPLIPLKADTYSAYDVMQALCKLFGYVLYETPEAYYFSAPDKTNEYRQVAWTDIDYSFSPTVVLSNHQFPTIAGNEHARILVSGKSLVRVLCNLKTLDTLMSIDLHKADYDSGYGHAHGNRYGYCYDPQTASNKGRAYLEYVRLNCDLFDSSQYEDNPPAGQPLANPINVHYENYHEGSREYVGGNWVNYVTAKFNRGPFAYDQIEDVLVINTTAGNYSTNLYAGALYSKKEYSAINLGNYFLIDFKVRFNDSYDGEFGHAFNADDWDLPVSLKWGDQYYQGDGTWSGNLAIFNIKIYPDGNDDKTFQPHNEFTSGHSITIPANKHTDLQGKLRLIFYTLPEELDVKMLMISDIEIRAAEHNVKPQVQDKYDYNLVEYRQRLSTFRLSEYKYEQLLTNHCINYSLSGVQSSEPTTNTSYEQLLLSRLAQWYDRTIEQLSVTVENEDIQPGVRIVRGNAKYIVLSRTVDWRNGQRILTIQRMYDEPQQQN